MTTQIKYERLGKFIYSTYRHGADISDVQQWMADDLGVVRPDVPDSIASNKLYAEFFARNVSDEAFHANLEHFLDTVKNRQA